MGLEAIKIAFRIGLLASDTRSTLEQDIQPFQNWAYVISASEHMVVEAIRVFCQDKVYGYL